jgi:uncharacterized protein YbaA (DUF1428 family)
MAYVEGFVAAVPAANKDAYRRLAESSAPLFKELGVEHITESWGDDVPEGKVTDFRRAVEARPDEVIALAFHEYPSRAVRDAAIQKMMEDPRMEEMGNAMPFDGGRMIFGGFAVVLDERAAGPRGYVDGSLAAVPAGNKAAYLEHVSKLAALLKESGAVRVVEAWEDDVRDGKVTDFRRAVKATGDEKVAFSWVEWPSKAVRDAAWMKLMADPRMRPATPLNDEHRRVYGGFIPLFTG